MPQSGSIDDIIQEAIAGVVSRATRSISKIIAERASAELERNLAARPAKRAGRLVSRPSRGHARAEILKWVADRRARRVPNFVIEATGCKTKKAIVAKYGEGATFEKGKPLPKAKAA